MNKTTLNRWIKALRSGDFEQTTDQLRYIDNQGRQSYCCLGVLCQITGGPMSYNYLSTLGLSENAKDACMVWNDGDELTFAQIADKLEAGEHE